MGGSDGNSGSSGAFRIREEKVWKKDRLKLRDFRSDSI